MNLEKNSIIKGYSRLKQFKKIELIEITKSEKEDKRLSILKKMVEHVCSILKELKVTHRVKLLHPEDIARQSEITYDIEGYSPRRKIWYELSSCSSCGDYQTKRLEIKYFDKNKKKLL